MFAQPFFHLASPLLNARVPIKAMHRWVPNIREARMKRIVP